MTQVGIFFLTPSVWLNKRDKWFFSGHFCCRCTIVMADCPNNGNTCDRHHGCHCHHYLVSTNTFLVIHNTNLKRQRKYTFKACFEKAFRKKYSVLALKSWIVDYICKVVQSRWFINGWLLNSSVRGWVSSSRTRFWTLATVKSSKWAV